TCPPERVNSTLPAKQTLAASAAPRPRDRRGDCPMLMRGGSVPEQVVGPADLSTSELSMTSDFLPAKKIVIAGAGYAGLHVALRPAARLDENDGIAVDLVDQHEYHQVLTELPRVAAGTRASKDVRLPLTKLLENRVDFRLAQVTGFDLPGHQLLTDRG